MTRGEDLLEEARSGVTSIGNPLETIARFVVELPARTVPEQAMKEARRATIDCLGGAQPRALRTRDVSRR
jgi:hypothetical protein